MATRITRIILGAQFDYTDGLSKYWFCRRILGTKDALENKTSVQHIIGELTEYTQGYKMTTKQALTNQ